MPWVRRVPEQQVQPHSAKGSLSVQQRRPAQPAALRRVVPAARLSGRPHSEASSVRRDAAVAPLSYQVPGPPSEVWSGPAWQSARAAAWRRHLPGEAVAAQAMVLPSEMRVAAVVAELVRPVAWAPRVRLPAEEAAAGLDALVQPPAEASALSEQPPVAVAEASGAMVALPPEAAGVALDAVAEPQRAEAAEGLLDVPVQRPGAAEQRVWAP